MLLKPARINDNAWPQLLPAGTKVAKVKYEKQQKYHNQIQYSSIGAGARLNHNQRRCGSGHQATRAVDLTAGSGSCVPSMVRLGDAPHELDAQRRCSQASYPGVVVYCHVNRPRLKLSNGTSGLHVLLNTHVSHADAATAPLLSNTPKPKPATNITTKLSIKTN